MEQLTPGFRINGTEAMMFSTVAIYSDIIISSFIRMDRNFTTQLHIIVVKAQDCIFDPINNGCRLNKIIPRGRSRKCILYV